MFDLKVINSVLDQLEEERGIPREKIIEAIEAALATAYKKEYGKKGQIVRATFDLNSGKTEFYQIKKVVDESQIITPNADGTLPEIPEIAEDEPEKVIFNPEQHILLADAQKIKKNVTIDEEMVFPLEMKDDYGRIASQTAKQVIIQKIREAEKISVLGEFGQREGEIVSGTVQRIERGNIFVDMGRASGILPYEEQIPGERYRQGERIRAYLYRVEETPRGIFLRLSRSHPKFLVKLFEVEAPEIANSVVEIKAVAREAGSRTKIAVVSHDSHIDPVGSLVGQRGVRVSTVMSELGGEKIDIIEWSTDPKQFVEDALSPAKIISVTVDEANKTAVVQVSEDQQSLAIGKGGQNVRLAAKLTGWRIDIQSVKGENLGTAEAAIEGKEGEGEKSS
jgi:N utilization substance protein A